MTNERSVKFVRSNVIMVEVPTETGSRAMIDVTCTARDSYVVEFSGELLDVAPEGLTASIQMTMLAIKAWRIDGGNSAD